MLTKGIETHQWHRTNISFSTRDNKLIVGGKTRLQLKTRGWQPRPQDLLLVQNGGQRNPWPRLLKWLQKFVRISSRKRNELTSFRLNSGFRLQKTNRAARRWKQPPKKPFHHVSRDKILHDSWSISTALTRGFSDRHFERGEGLGDEVVRVGVLCTYLCPKW